MSAAELDHHNATHGLALPDLSGVVPTCTKARAKHCIAALEEELQVMRQERGTKQRKTTYYISQGQAVCCMVTLYASIEDLIAENDCRCKVDWEESTTDQHCFQHGYIALVHTLLWIHEKLSELDADDAKDMLKKIKKGVDAAHSNNTSTLKDLVAAWINQSFAHDVCGKLLCPAEWDWSSMKVDICDRTSDYIISENSWPLFVYENYSFSSDNLEKGLFMSKILVQAFKATFTSPSSTKEADGDGDGADILENNRCAWRALNQVKVKTCVASIINMRKVTPHSIAYVVCKVQFALSSISSWRTINGDFDYKAFWNNIVDFFEDVPGPVTSHRVTTLLEWWTRKVFSKNHHKELTPEVVSKMSVTALAEQRKALEDAAFDSD
ncbi:hypothetical protein BD769DRAFT_1666489 [Suillus cothurnatus]|nr:hypothetical protein BD769DRAFT_1666489 [Suillus cothurnatus]